MKKGTVRLSVIAVCLGALVAAPGCRGGLSSNGRIAPTQQVPILSQVAEGYHEADAELSKASLDLALAANDAAWAIAAAPFRILFGLTPFETGYVVGVTNDLPEKTNPASRRRRRRRALGLEPAAEDRVEARRSKRRLELRRDMERQN